MTPWQPHTGGAPPGVYGALATPLDERGEIDEAALERLVDRMIVHGVDGISPVGTTGEGPRLTSAQRLHVTARVCRHVPTAMPVIAGVPVASFNEARGELDRAAAAGASAALVAPPSYYTLSDSDVVRLYERLADDSPIPLLLYNIPAFTKVWFAPDVVRHLADHPRVVGIKDSCGDLAHHARILAATSGLPGFTVFTGTDGHLVSALEIGARGTIAASLNLAPWLAVGVYRDFVAGRTAEAAVTQRMLAELVTACRTGDFPAGWKAALHYAGLCQPFLAPPAAPLPHALREPLEHRLAELGIEPGNSILRQGLLR